LPYFRPADQADEVLPSADVVLITGTTLVNDTLEHLLALCRPAARAVVVGPTVGLLPDALLRRGVDVLGGIGIQFFMPARSAFRTRRVIAGGSFARIAKAHRDNGYLARVVELMLVLDQASCAAGRRTDRSRECRFRAPFDRAPGRQYIAAPMYAPAKQGEDRMAGHQHNACTHGYS
jgi:putative heavy-metal chelation protein